MGQNAGSILASLGSSASQAMGQQYQINDQRTLQEAQWARNTADQQLQGLSNTFAQMSPDDQSGAAGKAIQTQMANLQRVLSSPYQQTQGLLNQAQTAPITVPTGVQTGGVDIQQTYNPTQLLGVATTKARQNQFDQQMTLTKANSINQVLRNPASGDYYTKEDLGKMAAALQSNDPGAINQAASITPIPERVVKLRDSVAAALGGLQQYKEDDPFRTSREKTGNSLITALQNPNPSPDVLAQAQAFSSGMPAVVTSHNNDIVMEKNEAAGFDANVSKLRSSDVSVNKDMLAAYDNAYNNYKNGTGTWEDVRTAYNQVMGNAGVYVQQQTAQKNLASALQVVAQHGAKVDTQHISDLIQNGKLGDAMGEITNNIASLTDYRAQRDAYQSVLKGMASLPGLDPDTRAKLTSLATDPNATIPALDAATRNPTVQAIYKQQADDFQTTRYVDNFNKLNAVDQEVARQAVLGGVNGFGAYLDSKVKDGSFTPEQAQQFKVIYGDAASSADIDRALKQMQLDLGQKEGTMRDQQIESGKQTLLRNAISMGNLDKAVEFGATTEQQQETVNNGINNLLKTQVDGVELGNRLQQGQWSSKFMPDTLMQATTKLIKDAATTLTPLSPTLQAIVKANPTLAQVYNTGVAVAKVQQVAPLMQSAIAQFKELAAARPGDPKQYGAAQDTAMGILTKGGFSQAEAQMLTDGMVTAWRSDVSNKAFTQWAQQQQIAISQAHLGLAQQQFAALNDQRLSAEAMQKMKLLMGAPSKDPTQWGSQLDAIGSLAAKNGFSPQEVAALKQSVESSWQSGGKDAKQAVSDLKSNITVARENYNIVQKDVQYYISKCLTGGVTGGAAVGDPTGWCSKDGKALYNENLPKMRALQEDLLTLTMALQGTTGGDSLPGTTKMYQSMKISDFVNNNLAGKTALDAYGMLQKMTPQQRANSLDSAAIQSWLYAMGTPINIGKDGAIQPPAWLNLFQPGIPPTLPAPVAPPSVGSAISGTIENYLGGTPAGNPNWPFPSKNP